MGDVSVMEYQVLDKGFIKLLDVMGTDAEIAQAARVSTKSEGKDDWGLINYLMRHEHMSPFEMAELKFHIKCPIFVARQWMRHRCASINEISGRYSVLPKDWYEPSIDRLECRQSGYVASDMSFMATSAHSNYEEYVEFGLSKEMARIGLPLSTYTEFYWKIDLRNLLHFIDLRIRKNAQYEIREYAKVLNEIVYKKFPLVHAAFVDHHLLAFKLSGKMLSYVRALIPDSWAPPQGTMTNREWEELMEAFYGC